MWSLSCWYLRWNDKEIIYFVGINHFLTCPPWMPVLVYCLLFTGSSKWFVVLFVFMIYCIGKLLQWLVLNKHFWKQLVKINKLIRWNTWHILLALGGLTIALAAITDIGVFQSSLSIWTYTFHLSNRLAHYVELAANKLGFEGPGLSSKQMQLPRTRFVTNVVSVSVFIFV